MSRYTRLIGLRYGFSRQRSRFTALVSVASMLGMTLGVASLITVLSVMNGFAAELRDRILVLVPHAYVIQPAAQWADSAALARALARRPGVVAAAPYRRETVLLAGPYRQHAAVLVGMAAEDQRRLSDLESHLLAGSLAALDEPFTAILGSALARRLGVVPGDSLRLILPQVTTTPLGLFPRSRRVRVVGLFEVGAQQDAQLAYTSLDTAARLLRHRGSGGLQLRTGDFLRAAQLGDELAAALPPNARYQPWSATQGSLFHAIRMEKMTVSLLLLGVVLVAAFNIVSTLVMAVTEKRRDIAVLRTMGATPLEISRVFLTQGLSLALAGVLCGVVLGVTLALNISALVAAAEAALGARLFDPQVYFIARLPARLQWLDVAWVALAALSLSVLAAVYPAWRASRVAPAEVLRYE